MKVAIFRPFFPPWEIEPLRELMNDFIIDFYITSSNKVLYKAFIKDIKNNIIRLPYDKFTKALMSNWDIKKALIFRTILLDTSIKPILFETILKNKYDIVETIENYTYSSLQSIIAKEFLRTRAVIMNWENIVFPPWKFFLRYIVNKQCDVFRVPSLTAKWKLIREGVKNEKIHYIPACVNTKRFNPYLKKDLKEKLGIEDKIVILYIGRLIQQKGLECLIKAFARVLQENLQIFLIIVGEGPLKNTLKSLVNELKIGNNIIFLGAIPYDQIHEIHAISDITVLPSIPTKNWMEQFGYVLIEAMACGKPIVASRSGAIPEIVIDNETGFLVEPGNISDLAEKISLLASDSKLREKMGYKGRVRVEKNFSYEVIIPKIKKLYYSIGG
ncbi:MAG: glycosyltransferase family 4 protein [Candidatus Methanomethylicaceae archaeon]